MSAYDADRDGLNGAELAMPIEKTIREAHESVISLDERYTGARERALRVEGRDRIDAAFDEADSLQREMITAIRRLRKLEREAAASDNVELSHRPTEAAQGNAH